MNMRKLALSVVLLFIVVANSAFAVEISVTYADSLQRYLPSMDRVEMAREDNFRENRTGNTLSRFNTAFLFNKTRLEGTEWAGERLIESTGDFTVDRLLKGLVSDNVSRFGNTGDIDHIDITIDRIRVSNYPVARIATAGTYVKGTASWRTVDGELGGSTELTANLVDIPALDTPYAGVKYAFGEPDEDNRVGPVLSYFVEQALIDLFPEEREQIHGPVFIKFGNAAGAEIL